MKKKIFLGFFCLLASVQMNAQAFIPVDAEFSGNWFFDRAIVQERAVDSQDGYVMRSVSQDEFWQKSYLLNVPTQIVFMDVFFNAQISHPSWSRFVIAVMDPWNNKLDFRENIQSPGNLFDGDLSKIDLYFPITPAFSLAGKTTGMSLQCNYYYTEMGEEIEGVLTVYYRRNSQETTPVIEPAADGARIEWQEYDDVEGYKLIVYSDEEHTDTIYTCEFDATGKLSNTIPGGSESTNFSHTIKDLQSSTDYFFTLEILGISNVVLASLSDKFTTTDVPTNINEPQVMPVEIVGYFSVSGAKLQKAPEKGMYIVLYSNSTSEKILR
ncbi:MAG: hypothetical protein LBR52_03210 [Prevotellaceae bacterium]|nr:hypothetical protein [Prevotellaceae bacterium]